MFRGGYEIERYLWHCRRILKLLGTTIAQTLQQANVRVHNPEGAFYLFLDFEEYRDGLEQKGITNDVKLCERLLDETGVAILPGTAFERPAGELTARMAYVNFDGSRALTASERFPLDSALPQTFLADNCGDTIEAVKRIADWIDSI